MRDMFLPILTLLIFLVTLLMSWSFGWFAGIDEGSDIMCIQMGAVRSERAPGGRQCVMEGLRFTPGVKAPVWGETK